MKFLGTPGTPEKLLCTPDTPVGTPEKFLGTPGTPGTQDTPEKFPGTPDIATILRGLSETMN